MIEFVLPKSVKLPNNGFYGETGIKFILLACLKCGVPSHWSCENRVGNRPRQ